MAEMNVRVQDKGRITIPSRIRKRLNLKRGDLVVCVETEAGVLLKPATVVSADQLRSEVKAVVHSIREKFANNTAEEGEALVDGAVRETRGNVWNEGGSGCHCAMKAMCKVTSTTMKTFSGYSDQQLPFFVSQVTIGNNF